MSNIAYYASVRTTAIAMAMPGGRLEAAADPISAVEREAMEEPAAVIGVRHLTGVYADTWR
jgi:ADP-ribose pyrophosphatase YjhB (NUDIX family)